MNRSEMKNLVTATLARHLNKSEQIVTEDARLRDDLQADSLDTVELVLEFEEMFKVDIPDDDVEQLETVGQTIDLLLGKVNSMIEENEAEQPPRDEPEKGVEDRNTKVVNENEDNEQDEGDEPEAESEED